MGAVVSTWAPDPFEVSALSMSPSPTYRPPLARRPERLAPCSRPPEQLAPPSPEQFAPPLPPSDNGGNKGVSTTPTYRGFRRSTAAAALLAAAVEEEEESLGYVLAAAAATAAAEGERQPSQQPSQQPKQQASGQTNGPEEVAEVAVPLEMIISEMMLLGLQEEQQEALQLSEAAREEERLLNLLAGGHL